MKEISGEKLLVVTRREKTMYDIVTAYLLEKKYLELNIERGEKL